MHAQREKRVSNNRLKKRYTRSEYLKEFFPSVYTDDPHAEATSDKYDLIAVMKEEYLRTLLSKGSSLSGQ